MEIEQLRQELNQLLKNIVTHSDKYNAEKPMPSEEVGMVLSKINKMQENLTIFKYLLAQQENIAQQIKTVKETEVVKEIEITPPIVTITTEEQPVIIEQPEPVNVLQEEAPQKEKTVERSYPKLAERLTLNDSYLFANQLFNKDMMAFNELVKSIDECTSLNEAAKLYLKTDWDIDNEHIAMFISLVEQKFSIK